MAITVGISVLILLIGYIWHRSQTDQLKKLEDLFKRKDTQVYEKQDGSLDIHLTAPPEQARTLKSTIRGYSYIIPADYMEELKRAAEILRSVQNDPTLKAATQDAAAFHEQLQSTGVIDAIDQARRQLQDLLSPPEKES